MTVGSGTHPKYNLKIVEGVTMEIAAELHPEHLPVGGLSILIVGNPDDDREVKTVAQAIRNLQEFGLFKDRDDEIVEPTPVMLHVVELLT